MALAQMDVQPAPTPVSQPESHVLQVAIQKLLCLAGPPAGLLPEPSQLHFLPANNMTGCAATQD